MRYFLRRSLKRIAFIATRRHRDNNDTPEMHHQRDVQIASKHSPQEAVRYSSTTTSNPTLSPRGSTSSHWEIPVGASPHDDASKSVEYYKRSATSLVDERGSTHSRTSSQRVKEQLKHAKEVDSTHSRRDIPHGIDPSPPKTTVVVTQPPPIRAMGTESIARPSAAFQQRYETQSRELSDLLHRLDVADKEMRAMEHSYSTLLRRHEEKSRRLDTARDELGAVLEQKGRAERTCATFRQKYEAVMLELERKQSVEHYSGAAWKESGVQTHDLNMRPHEHCVPLEENRAITDKYAILKQLFEDQSKELVSARSQRQEAENNCLMLRRQHEEHSSSLRARRCELQRTLEEKEKAQDDYAVLRQEYEALRHQNNSLCHDNRSLKAALEQRTSELHSVEKFLITADTFSGGEVVDKLRTLNTGVQQSVASMAEWMVDNLPFGKLRSDDAVRQIIEHSTTSGLLGTRIMHTLCAKTHRDNPILLEIALQAYLMYELYRVASRRTVVEEDASHFAFVDGIYQRMREAEGQAISGNWRALTYLHARPAGVSDHEIARTISATIISGISDVLLAAGCITPKPEVMSLLGSKFSKKMLDFVSLAAHVNKIIYSGVISEDLGVSVVLPEMPFDAEVMEDWDDDGDNVQGTLDGRDTVLCAIELGLMKRIKDGPSVIVVKPKVALVSVLDILDE